MPPTTTTTGYGSRGAAYGRSRGLPPSLRGSNARLPAGVRPSDLNDRGFLDRFVSDIGTVLTNLPRALVNIVGAPVSDAYSLLPGGTKARLPTATANLGKEIGESVIGTGKRISDLRGPSVAPGLLASGLMLGTEKWEDGGAKDAVEQYREHPGIMAIEDLGNVAIGGAAVSKPLAMGARRAAGQSAKGLTRRQKAAQLGDIADSGGPGARLAQSSKFTGDLLGHPYRATGKAISDVRLPGTAGHSLREVAGQVRASTPMDRMMPTPEMNDAATLRSLRAEVAFVRDLGDQAMTDALADAQSRLAEFETANADRLPLLEEQRLAPTALEDLTSPAARSIRQALDVEAVQNTTAPFVRARREVKGMVQDLREKRTDASLDILTVRDPSARIKLATRQLRDLDKALADEGGLAEHGIELPSRLERVGEGRAKLTDQELFDALSAVAENPALREKLPRLEQTLDLTRIDLYERMNELPDGALRNQLYDDATLTPKVAGQVRDLQRAGETLPDEVRSAVDEALGQSYRIPEEQLANPLSAHPEAKTAYEGALAQFTRESAQTDALLANYGLGDPDRWALRAVREADGTHRPMTADESPRLRPAPSKDQARVLRTAGKRIKAARRTLEAVTERAARQGVDAKADGHTRYRAALRAQRQAALAWDKARRAGDVELTERLRGELDQARARADKAKAEQRSDVFAATQKAQRAIEDTIRQMAREDAPVGATQKLGQELAALRDQLDTVFADADLVMRPGLRKALEILDESGVDLQAVDANALDNILRLDDVAEGDIATFRDAAQQAKAAVDQSGVRRGRTTNVENLLRAEERARIQLRAANTLERRLDSAEGRLSDLDPAAIDAARTRLADATEATDAVAQELGVARPRKDTPSERRAYEDRLLKAQVQARLRQREVQRAADSLERLEQKFADIETEMRASLEAAPAVARRVLAIGRAMDELDGTLREQGYGDLADSLDLKGVPRLLSEMEAAGVSPTFLRRLEERAGAVGYRAASEQPVKTPTMSRQRRRTMSDVELRRDVDRVKAESDIELAGRVMAGEMVEQFQQKFGRGMDQIAEGLIEQGVLNREAWRDMSKHQREKLLQQQGYNVYAPDQIFSFKVRRTGADDVWIPQFLNDALTEYAKRGPVEQFLTGVLNPATTTWKHFILALRPAWQVYNVVGNMAMAGVGGRMPVRDYLEFMAPGSEAHTLLREWRLGHDLTENFGLTKELSTELLDTGLSRDLAPNGRVRSKMSDALTNQEKIKRTMDSRVGQNAGRVKGAFDTAVGASYRVNSFMDNLNRASLYLYDTTKAGMDPEQAIRHANRTLGEYTKMSPTEKIYVRSVFPFYAWMRHITRLSVDMLKPDNITRTAILGTLVNTLGQPNEIEEMFPDYMAGDIAIGDSGMAVGMRGFNPWQDVLDVFTYNGQVSTRGALRSMHPGIQFGVERNTGINTMTGRPFSRPAPVLDDLGREVPTAPDLGTHVRQKFAPPQLDLARNVYRKATGQTTARYDTDDPVLIEGVREPSLLGGLGSFVGAPLRSVDVAGIEERRGKAMDRVSRQIARYQEEVEAYEEARRRRSIPERLLPFGR